MRKLFYSLCVLGLFGLGSCMTEMQESQLEINEALLKEIGQSESYVNMTMSLIESHDLYMSLDRDLFMKIMKEAEVSTCEVKEKGIPEGLRSMKGAVEYLQIMMVYCEARDQFNATYPYFWNLSDEQQLRALDYRNQATGFDPVSQLAKH